MENTSTHPPRFDLQTLGVLLLAASLFNTGACVDDNFSSTSDTAVTIPRGDGGETPFGPLPDYGQQADARRCYGVIDLVFVLDVSSSMDFVLDRLSNEINLVVDAANALSEDSHFGLVGYVDNHAFDESGPLEGGKIHQTAQTLGQAFNYFKQTYTFADRNPGDGPGGPTTQNPLCEENAPDALYDAATEFPWRDNANRVIILATDDTFLERPDNYGDRDGDGLTDKTDFPSEGDYPALRTINETSMALVDKKVRLFSFTRLQPPGEWDFQKCGTGRRLPWGAVSAGWSTPYNGATPIPEATDGKNFDLDQVRTGQLSLTETINNMVMESFCDPID